MMLFAVGESRATFGVHTIAGYLADYATMIKDIGVYSSVDDTICIR